MLVHPACVKGCHQQLSLANYWIKAQGLHQVQREQRLQVQQRERHLPQHL
jgi:hypothetical protein